MGIKLTETEIFDEWDHQRNTIDPETLFANSYHKAWWVCRKDSRHVWQTTVNLRALRGTSCPVCSNRVIISGFNDLAFINPEIAKEWHPNLNADLTPAMVGSGSKKKVSWLCRKNHTYEAVISERSLGKGLCPYCIGDKGMPGDCNIEFLYPEVFKTWDFDKNEIDPEYMNPRSSAIAWWICPIGHSYDLPINMRCGKGLGCPYCSSNRVLSGFNDLLSQYPVISNEWDYEKNDKHPSTVAKSSNSKVWWKCPLSHSWEMQVQKRTLRGQGCPYCANVRVEVGFNDFENLYPELLTEWDHNKNTLKPNEVTKGTRRKAWWICPSGHSYVMSISTRTGYKKGNCYYCSGQRVLIGFNDLFTTHPELCKEWDVQANGDTTPQDVSFGSEYNASWICSKGHIWKSKIFNRTKKNPYNCSYCSNTVLLQGYNDLLSVDPKIASQWHPVNNGDKTPSNVLYGSHYKASWLCSAGHEWRSEVKNRTRSKNPTGCAKCSDALTSKIQQAFHKALAVKIPDLQCDVRISVLFKSRKSMSVDMISIASNVVIEYDGEYYHSGRRSGKSLQHHLDHDSAKTQALLDAGYRVVRIRENGLQHLDMNHGRLMQISYRNGELMDKTVDMIINSFSSMGENDNGSFAR